MKSTEKQMEEAFKAKFKKSDQDIITFLNSIPGSSDVRPCRYSSAYFVIVPGALNTKYRISSDGKEFLVENLT